MRRRTSGAGLVILGAAVAASTAAAALWASSQGDVITGVRTFLSRDAVHPGETFKAAVRLEIGPGWHINANPAADEFLIPTSLEIADDGADFRVLDIVYPEARVLRLGFSESDVAVYSESALIGVLVRAEPCLRPGTYVWKGSVAFQACNDASCLPPEALDLEIPVTVVEPGRETHDAHGDVFKGLKFGPPGFLADRDAQAL